MASFQFRGLEEYARNLQKIGGNTKEICGAGVYAMADVVANAIRRNIQALPAEPDSEGVMAWWQERKARLTISEKEGLENGFGISPMQNDKGYWNVKLGFEGYNDVKTKKYPKGQPNALIARSIESGSTVREKTPFIRPAVKTAEQDAVTAATTAIDKKIYSLVK